MVLVAPSILSGDFYSLGEDCEDALRGGADSIHFDVMDGHFVPNISFGAPVLRSLTKRMDARFDVHLMISDPLCYIRDFADAGASMITFHIESQSDPGETVAAIRSFGRKAGIALRPKTDFSALLPYFDQIDMVMIMTVEPGFGGQSFMPEMCEKISAARREAVRRNRRELLIGVDGGIDRRTAREVIAAGANFLAAGSSVFGSGDRREAIRSLKFPDGGRNP